MSSLHRFLAEAPVHAGLKELVECLAGACILLAERIREDGVGELTGDSQRFNTLGERQKKLDLIANDRLKSTLLACPQVRGIASEEEATPIATGLDGQYLVLMDPLDGSSNIDVNVSIGTIFSILPWQGQDPNEPDAYLQVGRNQLAAGYFLYGPATSLVLTFGFGVFHFTLATKDVQQSPLEAFRQTDQSAMKIDPSTQEFAINMSNRRFWDKAVKRYIDDLLQGEDGPIGKRFNMRWIASMVAEVHRILKRGGIFMYPKDARDSSQQGKLRLLYEGNPMAWIVEQAGGCCSDSSRPLLDIQPTSIHQRVPVFLGSSEEVQRVAAYHRQATVEAERALKTKA